MIFRNIVVLPFLAHLLFRCQIPDPFSILPPVLEPSKRARTPRAGSPTPGMSWRLLQNGTQRIHHGRIARSIYPAIPEFLARESVARQTPRTVLLYCNDGQQAAGEHRLGTVATLAPSRSKQSRLFES
ncbi:hypothetical protein BJ166DRAFT_188087 [Pestalotiopsis sp. NC0098]|nr:hypothetical protein BJ166DRAFT_188087 [Pestalotiopsis sp. NC0098]